MMTFEEAALRLHDSELRIACSYLQIVDDATRVLIADAIARRWPNETAARQALRGREDTTACGESPGGEP